MSAREGQKGRRDAFTPRRRRAREYASTRVGACVGACEGTREGASVGVCDCARERACVRERARARTKPRRSTYQILERQLTFSPGYVATALSHGSMNMTVVSVFAITSSSLHTS